MPWQPPIISNLIYSQSKQKHQLVLNSERSVCELMSLSVCVCVYVCVYLYSIQYIRVCVCVCVCVWSPGVRLLLQSHTNHTQLISNHEISLLIGLCLCVCVCVCVCVCTAHSSINRQIQTNSFSQHLANQWPLSAERVI